MKEHALIEINTDDELLRAACRSNCPHKVTTGWNELFSIRSKKPANLRGVLVEFYCNLYGCHLGTFKLENPLLGGGLMASRPAFCKYE